MLKKLAVVLLVVLMSIESLAATVSDSDGNAFVTKAEFEKLKYEFNVQINRYNNSIDNKIDGVISNYLNSLRLNSKIERSVISYNEDGIVSIEDKTTLPWTEGYINIYGSFIHGRFNANARDIQDNPTTTPGGKAFWNSLPYVGNWQYTLAVKSWDDITAFKELAIYDVDWTNLTARWGGYKTTKYRWLQRQYTTNDTGWSTAYVNNKALYLHPWGGWVGISSTPTSVFDWASTEKIFIDIGVAYDATTQRANNLPLKTNFSFIERNTTETKNEVVISTKADNNIKVLTNYDGYYDFQNDGYAGGTTGQECAHSNYIDHYNDIFGDIDVYAALFARNGVVDTDGYMYGTGLSSKLTADGTYWKKLTFVLNNHYNTTDYRKKQNPYIGFTYNYINNLNQLWVDAFDTYVNDMEECDKNVNVIIDKDDNTKKHLRINAGLPICKVEREAKVTLPLSFKDDKDHYVWVKAKSFKKDVNPQDDIECLTEYEEITKDGVVDTSLINTTLKCIKVPANKTVIIKLKEMDEDSYIFIKWSKTDNSCAGGGTFLTPKTVIVEKAM